MSVPILLSRFRPPLNSLYVRVISFSGFRYNESVIDRNVGNVHFVSQSAALSANLTYVDDNGHAIIKVDNTTNGTGDTTFGRDTVYLISNNPLSIDSLVIMDVNHIPFGVCRS